MKRVIQTKFNKDKWIENRQKEISNILFERFGVRSFEELNLNPPSILSSSIVNTFNIGVIGDGIVSRGKSWQQILSEQISEELDKRINKEDYKEVNEYPLLNVCLDSSDNIVYIVLLKDGTVKQLTSKEGEYKII